MNRLSPIVLLLDTQELLVKNDRVSPELLLEVRH